MHLLQHIILSLIDELNESDGDLDFEKFKQTIPYIALPDAIRFYTKDRKYSHFELNNKDLLSRRNPFNGMKFPLDIKCPENILYFNSDSKMDTGAIGGTSSLHYFYECNSHLPEMYFNEVREHLQQDIWYDEWVRMNFDCSKSSYGRFYMYDSNNNAILITPIDFRKLIANLESSSLLYLIDKIKCYFDINIDQDFVNNFILDAFKSAYTEEMYNNTAKFFNLNEINKTHEERIDFISEDLLNTYKEKQIKFIKKYVNKEDIGLPLYQSNWSGK